jgi:hypothetical protein
LTFRFSIYGFTTSQPSSSMDTPSTEKALILVLLFEVDEPRNLDLAGSAPRRPEVQQHHFAAIVRELHGSAVGVLQREIRSESSGPFSALTAALTGVSDLVLQPATDRLTTMAVPSSARDTQFDTMEGLLLQL